MWKKNIQRDFKSKSRFWGLSENTSTSKFCPGKTKNKDVPEPVKNAPDVNYQQQDRQRTCLTYSFASALPHIGTCQIGLEVFCMSNKVVEKHDTVFFFREKMQNHKQLLLFKVLNNCNILKNICDDMVSAILCGSDGKMDHCITVWGNLIFDSNFKNMLPLTVESLDLCCSSDASNDMFVQVV